ncbi:ubiquitin carboxyl-terminal hydrolase 45-like isoform X2 [Physella acuta]|uniref:ubiquitin carboxyl-terminal hydrolase 45-like isoform X2 n=1 Tax=Physella acuta TaxID=109671 RepID=UPI0027DD61DD|nr:ubiquitin carboxyl-terminal hydrolase 45-like isoform X2 [Physella acuta]
MRVLEADPSIPYKMGKNKKHRIRKTKENEADESSDDGLQNGGCPHTSKAVNLAAMRKVVLKPTVSLGECSSCSKEAPNSSSRDLFGGVIEGQVQTADSDEMDGAETTVCICLQCGHQGCDRNSLNKHALKHYKTPHSGIHCITVNLTTWSTWCYICDDNVPVNGRIQSCIDFLQKQSGVSKTDLGQLAGYPIESPTESVIVNSACSKNSAPVSCIKVKGLSNLGNTCFFNAVMQSISQTRGLESLLVDGCKQGRLCTIPGPDRGLESDSGSSEEEDNSDDDMEDKMKSLPSIQTTYGEPGSVTLALLSFLQEMKGGTTKNGTVNPTALFAQVCKKAPRFKGFQQQDSHELLRYLIDSVRTEEIKRGQASILKFFKLPESISPKKVDEETKFKVKEYGRQVKHTFLDSLFGGQLVSTIKCEECKSVSQICEAFLDISLPVMEEKPQRPNLILIGKKKDSISLADTPEDNAATLSPVAQDLGSDKPSKYQERKNKRLAKKDAKRKSKSFKAKPGDADTKENHEEKPDEGSDEGSKADVDKDTSLASPDDSPSVDSVARTENSSPEGSKDGIDGNDDEDDPSDADVEDNIESDIHRLNESPASDRTQHSDSQEAGGDLVKILAGNTESLEAVVEMKASAEPQETDDVKASSCSHEAGGDHIKASPGLQEVCGVDHVKTSSCSHEAGGDHVSASPGLQEGSGVDHVKTSSCSHEAGGDQHKVDTTQQKHDQDIEKAHTPHLKLSQAAENNNNNGGMLSSHPSTEVVPSGEVNVKLTSSVDELDTLCSRLESVAKMNGLDGSCISCQVSVNNSQTIHLANGVGRLTLVDSDIKLSDGSGGEPQVPATKKGHERSKCGVHAKEEVSATFNLHAGHQEPRSVDKVEEAEGALNEDSHQHNILKTRQEYLREAKSYSMNTLAPRYHPSPKECSIMSCLNQFTAAELLTGSNKFGCKECTRRKRNNSHKGDKKVKDTVYSNANKQYLIFRPPAVLTLHLKRFEQTGLTSRKVNRHVDFPLVLDLAPYCSSLCLGVKEGQSKVFYSLYGVVEHSGRLSGGHYTAYIKVRPGMPHYTHFLHTIPPGPLDLLNVYLTRVMKNKDNNDREKTEEVDKDIEACAESLVPPGRWFHISDSRVNEVPESEVLRAQAYLLFYERVF